MNGIVQEHIDDFVEEAIPNVLTKTVDFLDRTYTRWKSIDPELRKLIVAVTMAGLLIGNMWYQGVKGSFEKQSYNIPEQDPIEYTHTSYNV
ncbi:hypothetical protein HQ533_06345 [Candidatus Woesearchaeota archaeon]|nr:hypothetical protein [Candidatus Woesearchaeota archaeon]